MSATRNLSTLADLPKGTNFVLKIGFFPLYGLHSKTGTLLAPSRQAVSEKKSGQFYSLKLNHSSVHCPHFDGTSIIWVLPEIKIWKIQLTYFHPLKIKKGGKFPRGSTKDHVSLKKKA